ncbi:YjcZ family sporulation protein [Paenibacillus sp. FSL H8-0034]
MSCVGIGNRFTSTAEILVLYILLVIVLSVGFFI